MNAKTMEGLAGASTSIRMVSTPMNVAKEAERKGGQNATGFGLCSSTDKSGRRV